MHTEWRRLLVIINRVSLLPCVNVSCNSLSRHMKCQDVPTFMLFTFFGKVVLGQASVWTSAEVYERVRSCSDYSGACWACLLFLPLTYWPAGSLSHLGSQVRGWPRICEKPSDIGKGNDQLPKSSLCTENDPSGIWGPGRPPPPPEAQRAPHAFWGHLHKASYSLTLEKV